MSSCMIVFSLSMLMITTSSDLYMHTGWRRGVVISIIHRMNKVNPRQARLVLGWVTVFRRVYHLGM